MKRDNLEDLCTDERIILKQTLQIQWEGTTWINLAQNRDKQLTLSKRGKETSGTITCRKLLDWLRNCQLLKKD